MSFSTDIKNELVRNNYTISEKTALLSALIKINGTLNMSNKTLVIDIRTENAKTAKLIVEYRDNNGELKDLRGTADYFVDDLLSSNLKNEY